MNTLETARTVKVGEFGALGDGLSDDREAIQRALLASPSVLIPAGQYCIGGTLRIPSGCTLRLEDDAVITLADGAGTGEDVFLLSNADTEGGNEAIRVEGGIWDGNNYANPRGGNTRGCYTGVSLNFINVKGLELHNLRLRNAETYFIRTSYVSDFSFTELNFSTTNPRPNQDGIHIAGNCHRGFISSIHGHGANSTKDDLVALVADDALARAQNLGLSCGPISEIQIENLSADDCHSFIRLASVHHAITDVSVEGVRGGCEACAINMDALRYCAMPLFQDGDGQFPDGAGDCRNITLRDFKVFRSKSHLTNPLVLLETRCRNFQVADFRRLMDRDAAPAIPTLRIAGIQADRVELGGVHKDDVRELQLNTTVQLAVDASMNGGSKQNLEAGPITTAEKIVGHGSGFDLLTIDASR